MLLSSPRERERQLIAGARSGQVSCFEELYRDNVGRVFALCRRMCGDPSLAEELAQEAFVRAWQRLATFRGESAFSTWLHRLTVNVVLGHLRSKARRGEQELPEVERADTGSGSSYEPGLAVDLERAISRLPARARTVFVMHDVQGYRHREIAQLAGMAEGTSKAQLHRARKLLREVLRS